MRYLKYFEHLTAELYSEIYNDEYKIVDEEYQKVDLNESEIREISKILMVDPQPQKIKSDKITFDFSTASMGFRKMTFFKTTDEWFYVFYSRKGKCYKCDQLEGLIEYLKTIKI